MSDKKVTYEGKDVEVQWDGRLCIHIGECGRAKGDLFVGGRQPWCQPDVTEAEDVVDVCLRCPTGALTYSRHDGGEGETPAAKNTIMVANNGPLYVQGELNIDGAADDMPGVQFRAALCRCGLSKNKPFCDNSHEEGGFIDRGAVGEKGDGNGGATGPLTFKRIPNGPLLVNGPVEIMAASGRVAWSGWKTALCRCGASKNKPFCDGAHRDINFEAE